MKCIETKKWLVLVSVIVVFSLLEACALRQSTLQTDSERESTADISSNEVSVVEILVSEANKLGDKDLGSEVESVESQPMDTEAETEFAETLPVTPTITMTANRVVERVINDYLKNRRKQLNIWIERSKTYFPMIEKILEEEGIPDELKYIAIGESGLRPRVRSFAGAVGMWQFMEGTGRSAGLTINSWVDERMDPEKASRAAAIHFKKLYKNYSQNWHLALAGYNCSYRCISGAVRKAGGSIRNPPSFWEIYPYLPMETRKFIPKFIAISLLVSNPEMYGLVSEDNVENSTPELAYDVVRIEGMMDLKDAAMLAGTDLSTIKRLNPSLRKISLPAGKKPYDLKIPLASYDHFVRKFNSLPPEEKVTPTEYVIRRGDTLGRIARMFDTSVSELRSSNGIRGHLIFPGKKLLIPWTRQAAPLRIASNKRNSVQYGSAKFRPIALGNEFHLKEQGHQNSNASPVMAVALSADFKDELLLPTIYTVKRGDTIGQISETFNVSIRDIQQWNNFRGTTIYIGQELTLHTTNSTQATTYLVKRGDSLSVIARRFGVSVRNLKVWNSLNNSRIFSGQTLLIN